MYGGHPRCLNCLLLRFYFLLLLSQPASRFLTLATSSPSLAASPSLTDVPSQPTACSLTLMCLTYAPLIVRCHSSPTASNLILKKGWSLAWEQACVKTWRGPSPPLPYPSSTPSPPTPP